MITNRHECWAAALTPCTHTCQFFPLMGFFPIFLASLLVPHREGADQEDPEKAEGETETAGDDENEQESRDVTDDNESNRGSDTQDADEDEPTEQSPPARRVTFSTAPSRESTSLKKTPVKPKLLARLKAAVFPSHDVDEHHSNHRILPVISGLVIPFSILLEIPGLTDNWYIRTNQNAVVQSLPNPASLEVLLAISMFFAIVANVSLICRFLEKGPVLATTLITIASLTIHGDVSLLNFIFGCA
jgi:potassium channel subfamily K, other eukaryote